MFGDGSLTFQEFLRREPLPLATIHDAVLEFLRGREDAVLCGAHAVNAYVDESRMSEDVDIASTRAEELAEELRAYLKKRFHIAMRVGEMGEGLGFRVYQVRRRENRHLVDVRPVEELPPAKRVKKVLVVTPPELIGWKIITGVRRRGRAKAGTDWRDAAMLLLTFPKLKTVEGPVSERLSAAGAGLAVFHAWEKLVAVKILPEDEDEKFTR